MMKRKSAIRVCLTLAKDLRELELSEIQKSTAIRLIGSDGVLVVWFNKETRDSQRRILKKLIYYVTQGGYVQKLDPAKAAEQIENLCARLDVKEQPIRTPKPVTKYVFENRQKYKNDSDAVRAFIQFHGGNFDNLYYSDLRNDLNAGIIPKRAKKNA